MTSILCIGDFGCGNDNQRRVAYLMEQLCKKEDVAFILGLGDNIYPDGTVSIYDPKFETHFEDPYKNLPKDIKFYHCLGNHDYRGSIESQIMYSNYSNRWVLPDNYYCFHGKVNNIECDFFAIDTILGEDAL